MWPFDRRPVDDEEDGEVLVREPRTRKPKHEPEVLRRPAGRVPPRGPRLTNYMQTAAKIGFSPPGIFKHELLQFFQANGIKVYDYEKVAAYMDQSVERSDEAVCWVWRPLRAGDALEAHPDYSVSIENEAGETVYEASEPDCAPYDKIVPVRVLKTVAEIHERFGERAKIFVSDYSDHLPDPFIAVLIGDVHTTAEDAFIIFDVWDEPGFTG